VEVEVSAEASAEAKAAAAAAMEAAVEDAQRHHEQWQKKCIPLERSFSTQFESQWHLVREEIGLLTKELAMVKCGLEELRSSSAHAMGRLKLNLKEECGLEEERGQRKELEDGLRAELRQLRADLQAEAQLREAGDASALAKAAAKADESQAALRAFQAADLPAIKESLGSLRGALKRTEPQFESLKESIANEARSRELGSESLLKTLQGHRDALSKDIVKTKLEFEPHKQQMSRLHGALEQERTNRDMALRPLMERLGGLERDIAPHKEEMPALRGLCDGYAARHDEHQAGIDQVSRAWAASHARLEKQLSEVSGKIDAESAARKAFMSGTEESILSVQTKVQTLATEHAETGPRIEALGKTVQGKVAEAHASHQEELRSVIAAHKQELGTRFQALEKSHKEVAQKAQEAQEKAQVDPAPASRGLAMPTPNQPLEQKTDDLAKAVRELQARVPRASMMSETVIYPHEDHISFLEDSLHDFAERFLGGLRRRRDTLQTRALVVHSSTESSGEAFMSGAQEFSTSGTWGLAESGAFAEQSAMQAENDGMTAPDLAELQRALKGAAVATVAAPELSHEENQELQKVLAGQRIELVMNEGGDGQQSGDHAALLKLNETIDFKPVRHGDDPVAEFKETEKVLEILGDVASIMKVYSKANLLIEGHTATPPGRMDQWAHDLAANRAEKVKATIASLGPDPDRLQSVGLPGNLGNGKVDTVLKIVSF